MIPSAEVVMERLRMALAEAGYPDAVLMHSHDDPLIITWLNNRTPAELAAHWQASLLVSGPRSCWSCWLASGAWETRTVAARCINGDCQSPEGPARPPRELLRAS